MPMVARFAKTIPIRRTRKNVIGTIAAIDS